MTKDPLELVGTVIDGQFHVDAFAFEGDLSVVFKGHRVGDQRPVAILCLNLPTTLDASLAEPLVEIFRERTRQHQRIAPGNANIVQSLAVGSTVAKSTGQSIPYAIHEWLDGRTLATALEKRVADGAGGWPLDEALALLDPVADGLAYLHSRGFAHHAISPNHLFVVEGGAKAAVKIEDLGDARAASDTSGKGAGIRVLLPQYAAPEQVDKLLGATGTWTDVYALAGLVLELVAGGLATKGVPASALSDPKNRPSPAKLGLTLPKGVEEVLVRALSVKPSERPADVASFWKELKSAAAGSAKKAVPAPPPTPKPPLRIPTKAWPPIQPEAPSVAAPWKSAPPKMATPPIAAPPKIATPPKTATPWKGYAAGARANSVPPPPEAPPPAERAELPLAEAGPPPSAEEPAIFAPALGPPTLVQRAGLALEWTVDHARAGAKRTGVLASRGLDATRAWERDRARPWVLARLASGASPRARAELAGAAAGVAIFAVLVVRLVVAMVSSKPAEAPASSASAEIASTSAAGVGDSIHPSSAPPASSASATTPAESAAIEIADEPPELPVAPPVAKRFTLAAATQALDAVSADLASCRRPGGHTGKGQVWVTFGKEGTVVVTQMAPPFAKTPEGECVLDRLRGARMPQFHGPPGAINYAFTVPN